MRLQPSFVPGLRRLSPSFNYSACAHSYCEQFQEFKQFCVRQRRSGRHMAMAMVTARQLSQQRTHLSRQLPCGLPARSPPARARSGVACADTRQFCASQPVPRVCGQDSDGRCNPWLFAALMPDSLLFCTQPDKLVPGNGIEVQWRQKAERTFLLQSEPDTRCL
jgi:hypothetical protein